MWNRQRGTSAGLQVSKKTEEDRVPGKEQNHTFTIFSSQCRIWGPGLDGKVISSHGVLTNSPTQTSTGIFSLTSTLPLKAKDYFYLHFKEEETDFRVAQLPKDTHTANGEMTRLGSEPRLVAISLLPPAALAKRTFKVQ